MNNEFKTNAKSKYILTSSALIAEYIYIYIYTHIYIHTYIYIYTQTHEGLVKYKGLPGFIINIVFFKDTTGIKNSSLIINLAFD